MNTKFFVALLALAIIGGCSSDATKNVVSDAPQSEIDKYNQSIEEEAARAEAAPDEKGI